jgi:hypothetical protein
LVGIARATKGDVTPAGEKILRNLAANFESSNCGKTQTKQFSKSLIVSLNRDCKFVVLLPRRKTGIPDLSQFVRSPQCHCFGVFKRSPAASHIVPLRL